MGPEVYIRARPGKTQSTCLFIHDTFITLLHLVLYAVANVCIPIVSWAGDLGVLERLEVSLCSEIPATGGLPGQPAARNVPLPWATRDSVCRGNFTILSLSDQYFLTKTPLISSPELCEKVRGIPHAQWPLKPLGRFSHLCFFKETEPSRSEVEFD